MFRYVVHPIWEQRLLVCSLQDARIQGSQQCVRVCVCDGTDLAFDWCADSDVKLLEHIFWHLSEGTLLWSGLKDSSVCVSVLLTVSFC